MWNGIKKGLSIIYSIYVLLVFFIFIPLIFLIYSCISFLPERKWLIWIYKINRVWVGTWSVLTGIHVQINGQDKLDIKEDYVFLSNHCNMLDIIMTGSCIQHPFKPLIKKELIKVPLFGTLLNMTSVPVDRSSKESRKKSFEDMADHLFRHISILIFPEGTRNRTDKPLKDFYDGAFKLAIHTGKPIMPIVLLGVRELQPVHTFTVYPGKTSIHILGAVPTASYNMDQVEELKKLVFEKMYQFIVEHEPSFKHLRLDTNVSSTN